MFVYRIVYYVNVCTLVCVCMSVCGFVHVCDCACLWVIYENVCMLKSV